MCVVLVKLSLLKTSEGRQRCGAAVIICTASRPALGTSLVSHRAHRVGKMYSYEIKQVVRVPMSRTIGTPAQVISAASAIATEALTGFRHLFIFNSAILHYFLSGR